MQNHGVLIQNCNYKEMAQELMLHYIITVHNNSKENVTTHVEEGRG